MNHQNTYFTPSSRNINSYQDNSALRPNFSKPYQPFNCTFQYESKVVNPAWVVESKVDGIKDMASQKKNSVNENVHKMNINPPSSTFQPFQPYEPAKLNPTLTYNPHSIVE
jgi:hypothetical protein